MIAFVCVEANQSGTTKSYRLVVGCALHPQMASMIALFSRLF